MEGTITQENEEITVAAFERWLEKSRGGSHFIYHRGRLAIDREETQVIPAFEKPVHVYIEPYDMLGKMAWYAYERGFVDLLQRRRPYGYDYIAFKRRERRRK